MMRQGVPQGWGHGGYCSLCVSQGSRVELYPESVFFCWYRSVFLGMNDTITEGKLGRYFQYHRYEKVRIYSK
jgi:hypothetical protein